MQFPRLIVFEAQERYFAFVIWCNFLAQQVPDSALLKIGGILAACKIKCSYEAVMCVFKYISDETPRS